MSEWQPIETAPKDGSMFLCWISAVRYGETDEGQPYQQDASQIDFCWWRDGVDGNGYLDPACGQIGDSQSVTHWMPLPAAPKEPTRSESLIHAVNHVVEPREGE